LGFSGCTLWRGSSYDQALRDPAGRYARGVVYNDYNRNGRRDGLEEGMAGVRVSNGREVVVTDWRGRYALPITYDTILFVIKPRGWMTPVNEKNLPRFYYIHKPAGSPPLRYAGAAPTGPLPESVDFPLYRHAESNRFRMVLLGDPQPRSQEEVDFLAHDVVEELVGIDAGLGISLGDLVNDDLSLFERVADVVAHVGIPWYNVPGNHDMNYDAADDKYACESFKRVFGPPTYAFDYGKVHFIVLDDVIWTGRNEDDDHDYRGGLTAEQLDFIRNDLALTPPDRLVVLMMHIPLTDLDNRDALFELLRNRPHTLSLAAHHHMQHHELFGPDEGWLGRGQHHHLVNVTACGSWWSGVHDEFNLPHATMRDGAPNGYSIVEFEGTKYTIRFKAARRPWDHQMSVYAPEEIALSQTAETEILVNVFAGSPRSVVPMRVKGQCDWQNMELTEREDPYYLIAKQAEKDRGGTDRLPNPRPSEHIWVAKLPAPLPAGCHLIEVQTTDMFGRTYDEYRSIRIHD